MNQNKRQQFGQETRLYLPLSASDLAGVGPTVKNGGDLVKFDASVLEARARGFGPVDIHSPAFKAWFGDWEDGIRRAGVSGQAGQSNDN